MILNNGMLNFNPGLLFKTKLYFFKICTLDASQGSPHIPIQICRPFDW